MDIIKENATALIKWSGNKLGMQLLNEEGQQFFIYDQRIIDLWEGKGRIGLIKIRNNDPSEAINCHPGQILGIINQVTGDNKAGNRKINISMVTLYYGVDDRDMKYETNKETPQFCKYIEKYIFRRDKLDSLIKAIKVMYDEREYTKRLLGKVNNNRVMPPIDFDDIMEKNVTKKGLTIRPK